MLNINTNYAAAFAANAAKKNVIVASIPQWNVYLAAQELTMQEMMRLD